VTRSDWEEIEMTSTLITEARELDARSANGIEVRLLWHGADVVSVAVFDATHGDAIEFVVEPDEALDAFHHPFAYAASHGVPFEAPQRAHDEPQTAAA
jgi:hypothetical protein